MKNKRTTQKDYKTGRFVSGTKDNPCFHGLSNDTLHNIWTNMKQRCLNKDNPAYGNYGGRGIKVCRRWQGEWGFINFVKDMGIRPGKEYSIDRINNDGHYMPSNCRWATRKEQSYNKRRSKNARCFTYAGVTRTIVEWSKLVGIGEVTLAKRIMTGWSPYNVLHIPVTSNGIDNRRYAWEVEPPINLRKLDH